MIIKISPLDSNKVLVTEGWDHALNYLPVMTFNEDVTGLETIEVDKIGLKFDKSSGLVFFKQCC